MHLDLLLYIFQFVSPKTFVTCLRLNRSLKKELSSQAYIYSYLTQNLEPLPVYYSITSVKEMYILATHEILRKQLLLLYDYSKILNEIIPSSSTEFTDDPLCTLKLEEKYRLDSPLVFLDTYSFGALISFCGDYTTFQILELSPHYGISGHYYKDFMGTYSYKDFYTILQSLFFSTPQLWIFKDHPRYPGWEYLTERNEIC